MQHFIHWFVQHVIDKDQDNNVLQQIKQHEGDLCGGNLTPEVKTKIAKARAKYGEEIVQYFVRHNKNQGTPSYKAWKSDISNQIRNIPATQGSC